jgi:hypothetical protein
MEEGGEEKERKKRPKNKGVVRKKKRSYIA